MSSLQKFHRRTNAGVPAVVSPFTTLGSGSDTVGFWLGDIATNRLVVAPKSTETLINWGSYGTARGTTSTTNGLSNTNTLVSFGQAAHPAAYYAKNLTTGGYNTWYLPAKDELLQCFSNKSTTPFATSNQFVNGLTVSSSEDGRYNVWCYDFGGSAVTSSKYYNKTVRAVRRSTI